MDHLINFNNIEVEEIKVLSHSYGDRIIVFLENANISDILDTIGEEKCKEYFELKKLGE